MKFTVIAAVVSQAVESGVVAEAVPVVKKVGGIIVLWGISYTLQEVASFVSIVAGTIGAVYTFCLLTKFWIDNAWKPLIQKFKEKSVKGANNG